MSLEAAIDKGWGDLPRNDRLTIHVYIADFQIKATRFLLIENNCNFEEICPHH